MFFSTNICLSVYRIIALTTYLYIYVYAYLYIWVLLYLYLPICSLNMFPFVCQSFRLCVCLSVCPSSHFLAHSLFLFQSSLIIDYPGLPCSFKLLWYIQGTGIRTIEVLPSTKVSIHWLKARHMSSITAALVTLGEIELWENYGLLVLELMVGLFTDMKNCDVIYYIRSVSDVIWQIFSTL